MKGAIDIHRELLDRGVDHEIVRLPRPVYGADDLPDALGLPPQHCLVVRMYEVDDRLVAVLVTAGAVPDPTAVLAAAGGSRLRPAPSDRVNRDTDFAASLVAPVLLPSGVEVLADVEQAAAVVYTPTGDGGTALGIHLEDLLGACAAWRVGLAGRRAGVVALDDAAARALPVAG